MWKKSVIKQQNISPATRGALPPSFSWVVAIRRRAVESNLRAWFTVGAQSSVMCLLSLQLYAAWKSLVSLAQTPDTLWLRQQVKSSVVRHTLPRNWAPARRGCHAALVPGQHQGGLFGSTAGRGQAKGGRQRQRCVRLTSAEKTLGPHGSELQAGACDKYNGGCLGLIFNQLGSQRTAALWDVRNSFPLRKAGSGKADSH